MINQLIDLFRIIKNFALKFGLVSSIVYLCSNSKSLNGINIISVTDNLTIKSPMANVTQGTPV